jgi:hypothetical protein
MAVRCVGVGEDDDRALGFFATDGAVPIPLVTLFKEPESGDKRRRYLRTGSLDLCVGDELGVLESLGVSEGVVGPVVGVAKVLSWS